MSHFRRTTARSRQGRNGATGISRLGNSSGRRTASDLQKRYDAIKESDWFKAAYTDRPMIETEDDYIGVEDHPDYGYSRDDFYDWCEDEDDG